MRWKVLDERTVYEGSWARLLLADIELPGGQRLEHCVIRLPRQSVATAVVDDHQRVLMLWRHRFITDRWGWELPAGWADADEDLAAAGRREVEEETGWRPTTLIPLCSYSANVGISDARHHLFWAKGASYQGPPTHAHEAVRVEWVPLDRARTLIEDGQIDDGASITALLLLLADRGG